MDDLNSFYGLITTHFLISKVLVLIICFMSILGFTGGALTACCGGGGPYNVNTSVKCGDPSVSACDDPSKYVSWDGVHLTEAAYRWITNGLLEGPYTIPQISISCVSQDA